MNRILTLYLFLLLCGTASAQQIVEWNDLQTITDNARRTVYYEKGSKQPLQGEYRIIRGLDEERVKFSGGIINGDYLRYRDGYCVNRAYMPKESVTAYSRSITKMVLLPERKHPCSKAR